MSRNRCGFSIPFYERAKALYAFGYSNKDISLIIKNEFEDLEFRTIDHNIIRQLIGKNVKEFQKARDSFTNAVVAEAEAWMKDTFMQAQESEARIARSYAGKIIQFCNRLDDIDPSDDDYSPQEINSILSHIEEFQRLLSKIAGTDMVRDVSIFKSKTEIKANLMPTGPPGLPPPMTNVTPGGEQKRVQFSD